MEIENEKGIFDLEKNSAISIEQTNPFFNQQGSMSLPYSIKRTPKNDNLLDFPHKYERKDQYKFKQSVNIRSGLLNENATLEILSIQTDQIEGVFYLYESSFYNQIKETKLTEVFYGVERWFQDESVPQNERVSYILDVLENMIFTKSAFNSDFTIFPVATNCEVFTEASISVGFTAKSQDVINEVYIHYEPEIEPEPRLKGKLGYTYIDDEGNEIQIPAGYGVSPFLKFSYVLRKIFEYFGFSLEQNIFDTDPSLQAWTVLNNTMDAIMPGYLIESQLVPDCTVNEFLDIVREGLCADFFIDVSSKNARLVLFKDIIASPADIDLTHYLKSDFDKIELSSPKQVRLTYGGTSLPFAAALTDTFLEFETKYPEYTSEQPLLVVEGVYPFYLQNCIWKFSDPESQGWGWPSFKSNVLSSMNFNYDTTRNEEREEHKMPIEAIVTPSVTTGSDSFFYYSPIIGTGRNLNSHIIIDGTKQVEEVAECPVMLSIEYWDLPSRVGVQANDYIAPGIESINDSSLLFWGKNGLFNKYWKLYDELLRSSFHNITYQFRLPAYLLKDFRMDRLKLVDGQPVIPILLKYDMQDNDYINVEMLVKTVKIYD